jgi:hypothetical protein
MISRGGAPLARGYIYVVAPRLQQSSPRSRLLRRHEQILLIPPRSACSGSLPFRLDLHLRAAQGQRIIPAALI